MIMKKQLLRFAVLGFAATLLASCGEKSSIVGPSSDKSENSDNSSQPAKSDLVIVNESLTPSSVKAGESINVSCLVKNQGAETAASSRAGYYLSSNTTWSSADVYLGDDAVGALNKNSTSAESASLSIPASTAPGDYYILFVADYEKAISESNESNNVAARAMTVKSRGPDWAAILTQKYWVTYNSLWLLYKFNSNGTGTRTRFPQENMASGIVTGFAWYLNGNRLEIHFSGGNYIEVIYLDSLNSSGTQLNFTQDGRAGAFVTCGSSYMPVFIARYLC
jgi:hypothetical protein